MLICLCIGKNMASAEETHVTDYNQNKDPFYEKATIYATWIMIYIGSTEAWWKPDHERGCSIKVDGKWQSMNWNNERVLLSQCKAIRNAGINVIVLDFTNGTRWEKAAKQVLQFCHDNGMKMAVAFNPQNGQTMESKSKTVWNSYCKPKAPHSDAYFYKNGKPLLVLYTGRQGYKNSVMLTGEYRKKFHTQWSSGEDPEKDKWGWQNVPTTGPIHSKDSMYVSGGIKYGGTGGNKMRDEWRNHIAWLDYSFLETVKAKPRHIIVGSYDDMPERNGWMVVDTTKAARGWQRQDRFGAYTQDAHYKRVTQWIKDGAPSVTKGGMVQDGAYYLKSNNGKSIHAPNQASIKAKVTLTSYTENINSLVWLYHMGDNHYRLIKLNAGLAFEPSEEGVILNWDSNEDHQRWKLHRRGNDFAFVNLATGKALSHHKAKVVTVDRSSFDDSQKWQLKPYALLPYADEFVTITAKDDRSISVIIKNKTEDSVTVQNPDGNTFRIPLSRLNEESVRRIRSWIHPIIQTRE